MMSGLLPRVATAAASMMLAACAAGPGHQQAAGSPMTGETITVAVGACFGFCPVYEASIAAGGAVRFDGQRHTAVLGQRTRAAGASAFRTLARELAPFRPAPGTEAVVECAAAVSDLSPYTVTWTDAARNKTVATVQSGCRGGPGQALVKLLRDVPERLGITDWTKQVTRPGASRG